MTDLTRAELIMVSAANLIKSIGIYSVGWCYKNYLSQPNRCTKCSKISVPSTWITCLRYPDLKKGVRIFLFFMDNGPIEFWDEGKFQGLFQDQFHFLMVTTCNSKF